MLRFKRRSQLARDRAPVRPHVLHSLPHGYGEGDTDAIANGTDPPAGDTLGTAESAKGGSGQHQSRCLVDAEPVTLPQLKLGSNPAVLAGLTFKSGSIGIILFIIHPVKTRHPRQARRGSP